MSKKDKVMQKLNELTHTTVPFSVVETAYEYILDDAFDDDVNLDIAVRYFYFCMYKRKLVQRKRAVWVVQDSDENLCRRELMLNTVLAEYNIEKNGTGYFTAYLRCFEQIDESAFGSYDTLCEAAYPLIKDAVMCNIPFITVAGLLPPTEPTKWDAYYNVFTTEFMNATGVDIKVARKIAATKLHDYTDRMFQPDYDLHSTFDKFYDMYGIEPLSDGRSSDIDNLRRKLKNIVKDESIVDTLNLNDVYKSLPPTSVLFDEEMDEALRSFVSVQFGKDMLK